MQNIHIATDISNYTFHVSGLFHTQSFKFIFSQCKSSIDMLDLKT